MSGQFTHALLNLREDFGIARARLNRCDNRGNVEKSGQFREIENTFLQLFGGNCQWQIGDALL